MYSPLPCDVYLWSGARRVHSYTGQPVVEIHTLGSPPLLEIVLRSICAAGARLAGPGEFTLRAFLAGRIDLTQAEAVLGVIDAGDSHELEIALGQLAGGLARPLHRLRNELLDLLAHVEAGFDFADEDLPFITREELDRQLAEAESDAAAILRQMDFPPRASPGVRAVLVGRPNTGKSSLFNALAGDRAALVSDHPGTTRDYLTAELDLDGVKCQLIDTAGTGDDEGRGRAVHRPLNGSIDEAAQSATAEQRRGAHVQVLCLDSSRPLDAWERAELARSAPEPRIVVLTKCDRDLAADIGWPSRGALETSSLTGCGIAALRDELRRQALAAEDPAASGRRHGRALRRFASAGRPMPRARPSSRLRRPRGVGGGRDPHRDWKNLARSSAPSILKTCWIESSAVFASEVVDDAHSECSGTCMEERRA